MMTKHTPGPWGIAATGTSVYGNTESLSDCDDVETVAEVDVYYPGAPFEANARLIAAAPDLLAAAKSAGANITFYAREGGSIKKLTSAVNALGAAIAKAEGE